MEIKQADVRLGYIEFSACLQVEVGTSIYQYLQQIYLNQEVVDGLLKDWGLAGATTVVSHELMQSEDSNKMVAWFVIRSVSHKLRDVQPS